MDEPHLQDTPQVTPWLDDGDLRLYLGDALETVRQLPDESVDCVVTSPPYWGLRDYGTGSWDGGDPDCDHDAALRAKAIAHVGKEGFSAARESQMSSAAAIHGKNGCPACGARRVDRQMGLEPTPDLFVAGMVELFREIRRVLAPHGTCFVNLGDSYASKPAGSNGYQDGRANREERTSGGVPDGLKQKDLVGIPWRVAFALQADGWWLRSDIIWAKPNPMPESVGDRPTKAHEYVFLLTKQPRYWFDAEAVRERYERGDNTYGSRGGGPNSVSAAAYVNQSGAQSNSEPHAAGPDGRKVTKVEGREGSEQHRNGERWPNPAGRNVRSVWQIATHPYPEAHFATYPEELARRCILAGCPVRVCRVCGKPSERIVERHETKQGEAYDSRMERAGDDFTPLHQPNRSNDQVPIRYNLSQSVAETVGWSDCGHNNWRPGLVLDPFIGSGTTAKVARDHQRHAIGIDLNATYLELAARRLQQLSLLTGDAA